MNLIHNAVLKANMLVNDKVQELDCRGMDIVSIKHFFTRCASVRYESGPGNLNSQRDSLIREMTQCRSDSLRT